MRDRFATASANSTNPDQVWRIPENDKSMQEDQSPQYG